MVKIYTSVCIALFLSVFGSQSLCAHGAWLKTANSGYFVFQQDTTKAKKDSSAYSIKTDTIGQMVRALQKFKTVRDTINIRSSTPVPNLSLQQIIKGTTITSEGLFIDISVIFILISIAFCVNIGPSLRLAQCK